MNTPMQTADPYLSTRTEGRALIVTVYGNWIVRQAMELERRLDALLNQATRARQVLFQCGGLQRIDSAGAWLLRRTADRLQARGVSAEFKGFKREHFKFMEEVQKAVTDSETCHGVRRTLPDHLEHLGRLSVEGILHLRAALVFQGRLFLTLTQGLANPARLRFASIVAHIQRAAVDAIPIIALLAFLIAIVLSYQGAAQLERFGAEIYTINLTAISVLREMGVLLTAILIAGRSGSAFAAEIGVMKLNEEIDALETMGIDTFEILVLPRVIALVVMMPLLTLLADIMGLAGGALSALLLIGVPLNQYIDQVQASLHTWTFWVGIIKAPVFGFLVATVATFRGLQVTGSAESVGRLTTVSVVQSIFLVILADAAFSIVFTELRM